MHGAVALLRDLGARAVLLKGGHLPGDGDVVDLFAGGDGGVRAIAHPRLQLEAHGTGCTLASASPPTCASDVTWARAAGGRRLRPPRPASEAIDRGTATSSCSIISVRPHG